MEHAHSFPHAGSTNWAELGDEPSRTAAPLVAAPTVSSADILAAIRENNEEQASEIEYITMLYSETHHVQIKLDRFERVVMRVVLEVSLPGSKSVVRFAVTFILPPLYPAAGHRLEVRVGSLHSTKDFASSMTKQLNDLAQELSEGEMPAISAILDQSQDLVVLAPRAQLASQFGCCVSCCIAKLKRGEQKHPQPVEQHAGRWRCMSCGDDNAILIPSIFYVPDNEVEETLCSFCFCGDSCMFRFPGCGCTSCFDCVVHLADLAIGEKNLVKRTSSAKQPSNLDKLSQPVGLACPNHAASQESVVYDHGLFKLLPPRTYNRYNFFAMELTLNKKQGVLYCPIPTCCGYFFLSDQVGSIVGCPFCNNFFCVKCQQGIRNDMRCDCEQRDVTLDQIDDTDLYRQFALGPHFALATESRVKPEMSYERPLKPEERGVTVRITNRNRQLALDLPSNGNAWYPRLANFVALSDLCPYAQYYRERTQGIFIVLFHGMVLDASQSLEQQGVFRGAILFVVDIYLMTALYREELVKQLRKCSATSSRPTEFLVESKKCPICSKPTIHYLGHGCHIMYGCHRGLPEWCYACGKATKRHGCDYGCPMFCDYKVVIEEGVIRAITNGCNCQLCPDCKPLRPCVNCTLCPMCTMDGMTKLI